MKQDYTLYIYRKDRRYKSGERLFSTTVWVAQTEEGMRRVCNDIYDLYPATKGWRFEYHPTMKTVINLMTGTEVKIPYDTPRSCDPSTELYWTM
jgi:hypothetical protein